MKLAVIGHMPILIARATRSRLINYPNIASLIMKIEPKNGDTVFIIYLAITSMFAVIWNIWDVVE